MKKNPLYFKNWLLIFIGIFIFLTQKNSLLADNIDSLKMELNKIDSIEQTKEWIDKCIKIGGNELAIMHVDNAIFFYNEALRFSKKDDDLDDQALASVGLANSLFRKGEFEKSLQILEEADNIVDNKDSTVKGKILRAIANSQVALGKYSEAYEAQMKALVIYETLKDTAQTARIQYGIGNNFFYQEQYSLSLKHFQIALNLLNSLNDEQGVFRTYSAISSVYEHLEDNELALENVLQALEKAEELDDKEGVAWTLLNAGSIQHNLGHLDRALSYLKEAKRMSEELEDDLLRANVLECLGFVYKDSGMFSKAEESLNESLQFSLENNHRSNLVGLYKTFSEVYYQMGNYQNYQNYIEKYINLKDTLFNEQLIENLSNLKSDFEVERLEKEQEIALLKKDKELSEFQVRTRIGIIALVAVIAILSMLLMYFRHKNQKEKNQLLAQKNQEIIRQNETLAASNQDLEKYAYIISHDLKEPLRNISGFTRLLERKLNNSLDKDSAEYIDFIKKGTTQMHQLLNDILEYSKIKNEAKEKESVDVKLLVKDVLSGLNHQIKETKTRIEIEDLPAVQFNKSQLFQVFQNLIANSLKFRDPKKNNYIKIGCEEMDKYYYFSVSDNGIGIEKEFQDRIFVVFQRLHHRGKYDGTGIGLATCKKIIEEHGGSISVNSTIGDGSTFYFTLPKSVISQPLVNDQLAVESV